jgi:SlyX protein
MLSRRRRSETASGLLRTVSEDTMSERDTSKEFDERFQILENKTLYQDRTIEELNEVVVQHQNQIDLLNIEVKRLRALFENPAEGNIETGEEPPPPHY